MKGLDWAKGAIRRTILLASCLILAHINVWASDRYALCEERDSLAPDFVLPDINGDSLALSSLRGRYVVLDFWGSWCATCIRSFPKMKEYYSKYAGKYEIIGIDRNDSEEKWKAAVEKHELPWLQVRQSKESAQVAEQFGVIGYPTQILIDPEGRIIKEVMGDDPTFYQFLDELFGKASEGDEGETAAETP